MKHVSIIDAQILTALGSLDETWQGLLTNTSGLKKTTSQLLPDTFFGTISSIACGLGSSERVQQMLDISFAELILPPGTSIVVATTKGAVDELTPYGNNGKKQNNTKDFISPECQPWNIENYIKHKFGTEISVATISAACASGTLAIIHAAMQIATGEAKFVWVIGIDLISQFVAVGFDKLKALSQGKCKPFDSNRDGLTLGEGFGAILVADPEAAHEMGFDSLANITGWGVACDAAHITAPSRTATGLITAINQAMREGGDKIGAINAHGTGTKFNDAMEIYAFNKIWQNIPAIHAIKGAIGHCLGAAGVIETAIAVKSLQTGLIPPTVGLETPEKQINANIIHGKPGKLQYPSILKCNSGFGGINAVLMLQK